MGSNNVLYVGSGDNNLYAIAAATGKLVFKFATGNGVISSPALGVNGTLVFGSVDSNLYVLS